MTVKTIYLVRHGLPQFPDDKKRFLGHFDIPLSEKGFTQARLLAAELSKIELTNIYCSDLKRTYQTAEIIGMPHKIQPKPLQQLREINMGKWDGLTFDEVKQTYPKEYDARGKDILNYCVPDGESFADCAKRVIQVFEQLLAQKDKNLLIVSHAGVNRIIIGHLIGLPLYNILRLGQDYGCLNIIQCGEQGPRLQLLNKTPILDSSL